MNFRRSDMSGWYALLWMWALVLQDVGEAGYNINPVGLVVGQQIRIQFVNQNPQNNIEMNAAFNVLSEAVASRKILIDYVQISPKCQTPSHLPRSCS